MYSHFCTRLHTMHECKSRAGRETRKRYFESRRVGLDCAQCRVEIAASLVYDVWMQAVRVANQRKGGGRAPPKIPGSAGSQQ